MYCTLSISFCVISRIILMTIMLIINITFVDHVLFVHMRVIVVCCILRFILSSVIIFYGVDVIV